MTTSPLTAGQSALLRRAMERPESADLSPGGRFAVEVAADTVVLTDTSTGATRSLPVSRVLAATVSDRGDLAVVTASPDGQGNLVGRLAADGTLQVVDQGHGASSPELSSDGSRLTWLSLYDVKEAGPDGPRVLGKVQYTGDRSEFLEDGRLLVRSDRDVWSTGKELPHYWLFDGAGAVTPLQDVAVAETLGVPVRETLVGIHGRLFDGATRRQCEEMADAFGYRLPVYRGQTPTRDRAIFFVPPGQDGEAFGLHRIEPGGRGPSAALSAADAAVVGRRAVTHSEWQPGNRRVAVTFDGFPRRAAVVDFDGGSRLLPGELASGGTRAPLWWSPEGRWLAVELREGERTAVHLYDVEADALFPVLPNARVEGWKDGRLEVQVDGATRLVVPGPMDAERGREYVLGPRPEEAGEIQVREGEVQVGEIRLPVKG